MTDMTKKKLPEKIHSRYKVWKNTIFKKNKEVYARLARYGQKPHTMIISCCDSRVNPSLMFGDEIGSFFIHRNIGNIIPPYDAKGNDCGTSAALEFGVRELKVKHIIILGHSKCGAVKNGFHLCSNKQIKPEFMFVNKWLRYITPAYNLMEQTKNNGIMIKKLEKLNIINSIINLHKFPFIKKAVDFKALYIHGLWINIETGDLEVLNSQKSIFEKV
jgi:carbonic anhydrase